jgi:hypothetical protein
MIAALILPQSYWFDTCSFTELRRTYPMPVFDPVWQFVGQLLSERRILSIEDVFIELEQQDDEIARWISNWEDNFISLDDTIQIKAREILATSPKLVDLRKGKSSADPFLISAAAVNHGGIIVTEENPSGGPPKVKIPDVARSLNISCIKLLDVLQREDFRMAVHSTPTT